MHQPWLFDAFLGGDELIVFGNLGLINLGFDDLGGLINFLGISLFPQKMILVGS